MNAEHVEANALGIIDVVDQCLHITGCIDTIGEIRLVKGAPQIDRLAIQGECGRSTCLFHPLCCQTAHSKVTKNSILRPLSLQSKSEAIELRVIGIQSTRGATCTTQRA